AAGLDGKDGGVGVAREVTLVALESGRGVGPSGHMDRSSVRVHMNRSSELAGPDIARFGQSILAEDWLRIEAVVLQLEDIELVLALERDVHPGLRRMKVEMSRSEAVAAPRSDRRPVRELAVLETENLERTGIFGFAGSGIVAAG